MDLIDTHQHLIYRDHIGYDWTHGFAPIATADFTRADYARLTAGKWVIGTVFMETGVNDGDYQAEARMMAAFVGTGGMLGQIASIRPEMDEGFDDWLGQSEDLQVVGYRRILHVVDDGISQTETFRRNLRKIGAKGLPFDLCFFARQLPLAEALLVACPNQVFVLDHFGNPDVAAGGFDPWAAAIRRLARHDNLVVKVSGVAVNCAPGTVSAALLQPYADHLLASFGPKRMLWGGDWPVVDLACGLPAWIDITRDLFASLSPDEQRDIGQGTAQRVYDL